MDVTENSTSGTSLENSNITHPIVRWMGIALLLCLITIGLAFWWPGHKAYQLVDYAEQNEGEVEIIYHHPLWMHDIVAQDTYLPWYDDVLSFRAPVTDEVLQGLTRLRGLQHVIVEISECSPESLHNLESCSELEAAHLTGNQNLDSFEWVRNCPQLKNLSFTGIPVPPAEWPKLLALPNFSTMKISENRISFGETTDSAINFYYTSPRKHLGRAEADSINACTGVQTLSLRLQTSDVEFWQNLGQNQTLTEITVRGPIPLADLIPLSKIPTLKTLQIRGALVSHEDWQTLPQLKGLQSLSVDVSTSPPESFKYLPLCKDLQSLSLTGNKSDIPLDWVSSCTNLSDVSFVDIPVPPEAWQKMLASPNFNTLWIHGHGIGLDSRHEPRHLAQIMIESSQLGLAEAQAINHIPDLEILSLFRSTSDEDFWETLGRNGTLNYLELSGSLPATTPLHLSKIPTLKKLHLSQFPFLVDEQHATGAWREFLDQRPDVEIRQR